METPKGRPPIAARLAPALSAAIRSELARRGGAAGRGGRAAAAAANHGRNAQSHQQREDNLLHRKLLKLWPQDRNREVRRGGRTILTRTFCLVGCCAFVNRFPRACRPKPIPRLKLRHTAAGRNGSPGRTHVPYRYTATGLIPEKLPGRGLFSHLVTPDRCRVAGSEVTCPLPSS